MISFVSYISLSKSLTNFVQSQKLINLLIDIMGDRFWKQWMDIQGKI